MSYSVPFSSFTLRFLLLILLLEYKFSVHWSHTYFTLRNNSFIICDTFIINNILESHKEIYFTFCFQSYNFIYGLSLPTAMAIWFTLVGIFFGKSLSSAKLNYDGGELLNIYKWTLFFFDKWQLMFKVSILCFALVRAAPLHLLVNINFRLVQTHWRSTWT